MERSGECLIINLYQKIGKLKESLCIIGAGVAGNVCAMLLADKYEVTVIESNNYLGGHTHTHKVSENHNELFVDSGFIVLNDKNYPNFNKILKKLGVEIRDSEMSFSFFSELNGFCYAGNNLNGLFGVRKNLFSPKFYSFLYEISKFCSEGERYLKRSVSEDVDISSFVKNIGLSKNFIDQYLLPMISAIWSSTRYESGRYPAKSLLSFFKNHGLLSLADRPKWQTVVSGSHSYVNKIYSDPRIKFILNEPVLKVIESDSLVNVTTKNGSHSFSKAVIATHADSALSLLGNPSNSQLEILSKFKYSNNNGFLHTDESILPPYKRTWSSWNSRLEKDGNYSISYYMNCLQGINSDTNYIVTLNTNHSISNEKIIKKLSYTHPIFDDSAVSAQKDLDLINSSNIMFCGSYYGYGFHEDAVTSAINIVKKLGVEFE